MVIFDLDGTLVNAYPAIVQSFNFTMKKLGLPPQSDRTIRRAVGWGDTNLIKPFVAPSALKKALLIYRKHHQISLRKKTKFLPGVKKTISLLKREGYKLALASNRPTKFSHIILGHLNIKKYFNYTLCGDRIKRAKPHPDIILKIFRRLGLKRSEGLYVGDMTVDILAGKRAKVMTVAVTTGSNTRKELKSLKPYQVIDNITQLQGVLNKLNQSYPKRRVR